MTKIKVTAIDSEDKKQADLLQEFTEYHFEKYRGREMVEAIETARNYIEQAYRIKTPDRLWNRIAEAHACIVVDKFITEDND